MSGAASEIRLVVFDLGRVLVRICESWDHACEIAQLPIRLRPRDEALKAALKEPVVLLETGRIDTPEFCRLAGDAFGVDAGHIRAVLDAFLLDWYPGVPALLDEIAARGYATGCLTNTQSGHWEHLSTAAPMSGIRHRFASHLLGLRKPDPEIYVRVEGDTGFSGPQLVFFDDMLENVEAARRRGWHGHQIDRARDQPLEQIREHLIEHRVLVR